MEFGSSSRTLRKATIFEKRFFVLVPSALAIELEHTSPSTGGGLARLTSRWRASPESSTRSHFSRPPRTG